MTYKSYSLISAEQKPGNDATEPSHGIAANLSTVAIQKRARGRGRGAVRRARLQADGPVRSGRVLSISNRQSESFAREGIELDVSTMADWVDACTASLALLSESHRRHMFAAERLHGDDTTVPVLGKNKTVIGRLALPPPSNRADYRKRHRTCCSAHLGRRAGSRRGRNGGRFSARFAADRLQSLQEKPNWAPTYRFLASCYAQMGRMEEAREAITRLRTLTSVLVPSAAHWRNPDHRELYLSGLRLATGEAK